MYMKSHVCELSRLTLPFILLSPCPTSTCHQTGSTAKLAEELFLTQAIGLHHLTEEFIRIVTGCIDNAGPADKVVAVFALGACQPRAFATQAVLFTSAAHLVI